MDEPLDELYLNWLFHEVVPRRMTPGRFKHWHLLRQMYKKEFVWLIPNDDNRVEDGRELRREFFKETGAQFDDEWSDLGCSLLEMLIALSRRLAFEADGTPREWFWALLRNMRVDDFIDPFYEDLPEKIENAVDTALDKLVWRQYEYDGTGGGLFPLVYPDRDQRDVEIWYQLNAYLLENS